MERYLDEELQELYKEILGMGGLTRKGDRQVN